MLKVLVFSFLFLSAQSPLPNPDFLTLKQQLETYGFKVKIDYPPRRGAYGLIEAASRTIWINPVVFDLNIATPTLIHEGVHAAQICAGKGKITRLGLEIRPINQARPFFSHYHDIDRQDLEQEAYAVQTQENSLELVLSLLKKHCSV